MSDHLEVTAGVDMDVWSGPMVNLDLLWDCSYGAGYEDSSSMPVMGLGVGFEGVPGDG